MTAKPPPTPPENQSHKGTGDMKPAHRDEQPKGGTSVDNPDKRGHQGNSAINLTPQRSVQDR